MPQALRSHEHDDVLVINALSLTRRVGAVMIGLIGLCCLAWQIGWIRIPALAAFRAQLALAFGLIFLSIGLQALVFHVTTHLDRRRRLLIQRWGGLIPWRTRQTALVGGESVTFGEEYRGSGKHRRLVYPLAVATETGPRELCAPTDYAVARQTAERIAAFLHVPLTTITGAVASTRGVEDLDRAWNTRTDSKTAFRNAPQPPARVQTQIAQTPTQLTIRHRPRTHTMTNMVAILITLAAGTGIYLVWRHGTHVGVYLSPLHIGGILFCGIILLTVPFMIATQWCCGHTINITREEITLHSWTFAHARKTTRMATASLEEFEHITGKRHQLVFRSDTAAHTVELPISTAEAEYLYQLIGYTLTTAMPTSAASLASRPLVS